MGTSNNRKERRAKAHRPPAAAPVHDLALRHTDDIDFESVPAALLNSSSLGGPPVNAMKPVMVPGALNAHIYEFLARNVGARKRHVTFKSVTLALWRILLREEYRAHQQAKAESRTLDGLPTPVTHGLLFTAVREELQLMRDEATN